MAELPDPAVRELRPQLERERDRVRGQLRELGHEDRSATLTFDDGFADSSQVTAERGEIEALAGQLTELLREIEDALGKMDDGTYGRCESCGREIAPDRLEAIPAARRCMACASAR